MQQQKSALQEASITSHNVHSVRLRVEKILAQRPYVYLVQEATVLEAEIPLIKDKASGAGYDVTFSQPFSLAKECISREWAGD